MNKKESSDFEEGPWAGSCERGNELSGFIKCWEVLECKHYICGHYPSSCFYPKHSPVYFSKRNVSEIGFCFRLQVKPELNPMYGASP
jgi:hypothetical protein